MTFGDVEVACQSLREKLRQSTGITLSEVSVERPSDPEDELHFVRLVAWGYVFLVEVASTPIRHIQTILRGANPREHKKVADAVRLVRNLRTSQAHQLSDGSSSDLATKNFVSQWLAINDGDQRWPTRIRLLCGSICEAIGAIIEKWDALTADEPSRADAVAALLSAVDRQWPPHLFDRFLEEAATELGINGMDYPLYRALRMDDWRKLADCFQSRDDAEVALKSAIRSDLRATFGQSPL